MLDRLLPGEEEEHQKVFEKGIELKRKKLREIQVRTMKLITTKKAICGTTNNEIKASIIVLNTTLFYMIYCTEQAQKDILMIERMKGHQYGDSRRRDRESEM